MPIIENETGRRGDSMANILQVTNPALNTETRNIGNNPALKNALDLFEKGDTKGLEQIQSNLFEQKKINPINMMQNFFGMK